MKTDFNKLVHQIANNKNIDTPVTNTDNNDAHTNHDINEIAQYTKSLEHKLVTLEANLNAMEFTITELTNKLDQHVDDTDENIGSVVHLLSQLSEKVK